jgi:uncharacterized membrane protein YcaP (DUF421 family)
MVILAFSWHELLMGEEDWSFLGSVVLRSAVMFTVSMIMLRVIGMRGVMQNLHEIVLIITLGSAAGDASFYSNVGLLPCILVFIVILGMYKIVNFFSSKSIHVEQMVEGKEFQLVRDGRFVVKSLDIEMLNRDELFSDLRYEHISHLGQIERAYVEPSGKISVFFFPDDRVKFGMPILPEELEKPLSTIAEPGMYSCAFCGFTGKLEQAGEHVCPGCKKSEWLRASDAKRVK